MRREFGDQAADSQASLLGGKRSTVPSRMSKVVERVCSLTNITRDMRGGFSIAVVSGAADFC
jgi:hypothetical protein